MKWNKVGLYKTTFTSNNSPVSKTRNKQISTDLCHGFKYSSHFWHDLVMHSKHRTNAIHLRLQTLLQKQIQVLLYNTRLAEIKTSSDVSPWPLPWSLRPKSKSLALALCLKSLALALALGSKSLALALKEVLGLGLGLANFVIIVIFLGVYCLAFFFVNCH